jgi:DNA modification methylase
VDKQITKIKAIDQVITNEYALYLGDACELIDPIPSNSIHFGLHSPPFEGLYKFSRDPRDISNSEGDKFWEHYHFIIEELFRVTLPGRLHSVHCMQLPTLKAREGFVGLRDFRGDIIRAYQKAGWYFHSEVCIWKDPVVAQQRTKSIRLLHKQIVKDRTMSGQGLADYIVTFRKPGDNAKPVAGCFKKFIGPKELEPDRSKYTSDYDRLNWYSIEVWQRYASPVWMDINQSRTLQYRLGRGENDEQHISPLQLDVIERCVDLWSNPGEIVFTPFMGIGSEIYSAMEMGRKGIGIELKVSYFQQAVKNISSLKNKADFTFNLLED